ncbi:MAG TPA: cupin domain-containing protein [Paludibacter sp.]
MKTSSENFLIGTELPIVEVDGGLTRKMMGYDGQLMLLEVKFKKGSIGYAHQHFHSQCTYVVSGVFEVTINGVIKILKSGDGFYVEPDALHGAVCLEEGVLIDTFSPMRLDFLKK